MEAAASDIDGRQGADAAIGGLMSHIQPRERRFSCMVLTRAIILTTSPEVVEGGDDFAVSFLGSELTPQFLRKPELHVDIFAAPLNSSGNVHSLLCNGHELLADILEAGNFVERTVRLGLFKKINTDLDGIGTNRENVEIRQSSMNIRKGCGYQSCFCLLRKVLVQCVARTYRRLEKHHCLQRQQDTINQNARLLVASDLFDGHDGPGFCDRHGRCLDLDSGSHGRLCSSGPCLDIKLVEEDGRTDEKRQDQVAFHVFARPSAEDLSVKHDLEAVPDLHPAL
ncbi:hypothetical protein KCU83_g463, partial [Aureobasidium melanogenum]